MTMPVDYRVATVVRGDGTTKKVTLPVRLVPVDRIIVDSEYQRDLDRSWVQKQKNNGWDEALAQVVTLSSRGGLLHCVDGQHRVELARECHIDKLWAYVIEGLSKKEEADLFTQFQLRRRALKVYELFKADLVADKAHALDIVKVVHSHGLRIDRHAGVGVVRAVGALVRVHRLGGRMLLDETLRVLLREWSLDDADVLQGKVIEGLAIYLHSFRNDPNFDMTRLDRVMPKIGPTALVRRAQKLASERASASVSPALLAEALRNAYNEGLAVKNKLGSLVGFSGKKLPGPKTQ